MNIGLVTPASPGSRAGNRITALRWARILRQLGHRVNITQEFQNGRHDLMIALHARRSAPSIARFARLCPDRPVILALTGTDLYKDIHESRSARRSLELAWRCIVLQPMGIRELSKNVRRKTRTIYQSVPRPRGERTKRKDRFDVCVIGHLRAVKDPFRTAMAARLLPADSRIRVTHVGASLTPGMARRARAETASHPRYSWVGEMPRWRAMRVLSKSRLLVLTSKMEGGANVVSEALAAKVPILSSRISGSVGLLGKDYPGYFATGDTRALADLLGRAETDGAFYAELERRCERLAHIVDPAREKRSWVDLLRELPI